MTIENKSDFLSSQKEICEIGPKPELEPDKVCPTCIPDENFVAPDWWSLDKPFLNKKTCEYSIAVTINENGDTFTVGTLGAEVESNGFNALKRAYVKPGLRMMLAYYGKMISDEIICALPPENPGDTCGPTFDVNFRDYIEFMDQPVDLGTSKYVAHSVVSTKMQDPPVVQGVATNMDALEVYARTPKFRFTAHNDSGILQILVTVPAFIFDKVPDAPDLPEVDTDIKKLSMNVSEFSTALNETISALEVFSKYQSYFYQTENGNLFFADTNDSFYLSWIVSRMKKFRSSIKTLVQNNGFRFGNEIAFLPKAHKIEIVFDKSDEEKPFKIKRIKVKQKNCRWKKMKKGFADPFMKKGHVKDQTTMGYIAALDKIHPKVTARQTPPWLDFVLEYTYPQLGMDFGSADKFKDQRPDTCLSDINAINNAILSSILSFSDSFAYQFNKANCLSMYGSDYIFDSTPIDFKPEEVKFFNNIPDFGFDREAFKKETFGGKVDYMKFYVQKKYRKEKREIKEKSPILKALSDFKLSFEGDEGIWEKLRTLIGMFNPCNFKDFVLTLLKCLFRGMDMNTAYLSIIKSTLGALAGEGLEVIIMALPADKQEEIRKIVEKEFKDMPAPWEPGWKAGSLDEPRTNRATEAKDQRLNAEGGLLNLKNRIKQIFSELKKSSFNGSLEISFKSDTLGSEVATATTGYTVTYSLDSEEGYSEIDFSTESLPLGDTDGAKIDVFKFHIDQTTQQINEYITNITNYIPAEGSQALQEIIISKTVEKEKELLKVSKKLSDIKTELVELRELLADNELEQIALEVNPEVIQEIKDKIWNLGFRQEEKEEEMETINQEISELRNGNLPDISGVIQNLVRLATSSLAKIEQMRGESLNLQKDLQETQQYDNWDNLTPEEQEALIEEEANKNRFATLNPGDNYEQGTLGKALGNTQQAITKAYIDAIIETAEIQEIMKALDNLPGIKILGSFIAKFKCPKTHFIFPPIDSFLSTLTLNPCDWMKPDLALPELKDIPRLSWSFILDNLVAAFIKALKLTISQALAALFAKLAQLIDSTLCKLLGGQLPSFPSLMDVLGREECKESEILKAAGLAGEGRTPATDEDYATLAKTISNAGTGAQVKRALTGNPDRDYLKNVSTAVQAQSPAFADALSNSDAVGEFFEMAAGLLTPDQLSALEDEVDSSPFTQMPSNKCLTNVEKQKIDNATSEALNSLPSDVLSDYKQQQQDMLQDDVDQVINMVLNGPNSILSDIIDQALAPTVDPDCAGNINSVGAVLKKAREAESFKNVRAGMFSRVQKAFMDDVIDWNLWEAFDGPGILSQILADKKGGSLNYYNWYRNVRSSLGWLASLFPEAAELPATIGIIMRDQYLATDKQWNKDVTPKLNLRFETQDGDETWKTNIRVYDGGKDSFAHKIKVITPEFGSYDIEVVEDLERNHKMMLRDLNPYIEEAGRYRAKIMRAFLKKSWSGFSDVNISLENAEDTISGLNNMMFGKMMNELVSDSRGQTSQGFLYGYNPVEITADDLTYVNPEPGSTDYTYQEEANVLGKSLTNNPRVQFLDPAQHGGSYSSPFYNILAEEKQGWSQFTKIIVASDKDCKNKQSNFMFFQDIMDKMSEEESKIKPDERLKLSPACVIEKPFDKIASPSTLSSLGGIVTAIIRMHVVDYMLRTFSINANVDLNFKRNHSKIISKLIVKSLEASLSNQYSFFASTYEGSVYWLLFLEQATQSLKRKIDNGDIESDSQLDEIMNAINDIQKSYVNPTWNDVFGDIKNDSVVYRASIGGLIAAGGLLAAPAFIGIVTLSSAFSLNQLRFSAKLGTIYEVREECMDALAYLVEEQLDFYSDMLSEALEPRPYIYDISKFFIGAAGIMLKGDIRAGEVEVEAPTGGKSNFDYGSIPDCVHNVNTEHPLAGLELDAEDLNENGGLFLEKYLRIEDKIITPQILATQRIQINRTFLNNRSSNLRNVVNIAKFKQFLSNNQDKIPTDANISDFFGNAKMKLLEGGYGGSIGIKFGVRLCMVMPRNFKPLSGITSESLEVANSEKSYIFKYPPTTGSKYVFPLCSYERDILDTKLISYVDSDENFNQDLKCYVDMLCETPEFKLLFDHIVCTKRVPSLASVYSYLNFYSSLGKGSSEREDADDNIPINLENVFNDTKQELRRLFVSNYKRKDFDPDDEEDSAGGWFKNMTKGLLSKTVNNIFLGAGVPWWMKWRYKQKQTNEDGEPCGNQFGSLVSTEE